MNSIIKFFSAMILAFVVFINSIGNFFGIGDLIPTQPEEPTTTSVSDEATTVTSVPTTLPEETTTTTLPAETTTTTLPAETTTTTAASVDDIAQRVKVGGKYVCFGWSAEKITSVLGAATDTIYESTKDGKKITTLVYASDYSKFAAYQLVDNALSGFYTVDTAAAVTDGEKSCSIASSGDTALSKLSIRKFTDSHKNDVVYAIYVTYNGFSLRTKDLTDQDGQTKLNFHTTNALRAINGVYAYEYCDKAEKAIELHCADMAARGYFDHISPEGESVADRLHAQGINYRACAENIGGGTGNAFTFVDAWYNSDAGHREALLSTSYDYMGAAFAVAADGTTYTGQNFYRPF